MENHYSALEKRRKRNRERGGKWGEEGEEDDDSDQDNWEGRNGWFESNKWAKWNTEKNEGRKDWKK